MVDLGVLCLSLDRLAQCFLRLPLWKRTGYHAAFDFAVRTNELEYVARQLLRSEELLSKCTVVFRQTCNQVPRTSSGAEFSLLGLESFELFAGPQPVRITFPFS